jgi:hypothetical protein
MPNPSHSHVNDETMLGEFRTAPFWNGPHHLISNPKRIVCQ